MGMHATYSGKKEKDLLQELLEEPLVRDPANDKLLRTLEVVYLARLMDDKMEKLVRQNKGATFQLSVKGHEMVGAVVALGLQSGKDWAYPYYRDRAFALGLGCTPEELFSAFLARDIPHHSGGRMMPDHFSHHELRIPCQSSCVGSQYLQAVGCAMGIKLSNRDEVVYVSGGDGSTSQGDFHEALNFSCIHRLAVIFVIQDNGWAISVPLREQTAGGTIAKIAKGYENITVSEVDGCDYRELQQAVSSAVAKGRAGLGPTVIVAHVPRIGPHSNSDDPKKYKNEEEIREEASKDPIPRLEAYAREQGILSEEIDALKARVIKKVEEAALQAEAAPLPLKTSAREKVFAPFDVVSNPTPHTESVVLMDAINHAIAEEMERDPGLLVFGEDVARGKGGVFGLTRTLTDRFGVRCFNTPLAESTIIGLAIGLASDGVHRCVAEIQFADYFWTGVNQLFNELASIYYRSNGEWTCPVVIRMPYGGYIQGGPYHSQSVEAFLCHCPGLKVVIPSNASDAKRLLKAAIRDPNPVVFLEHKSLYRQRLFVARPEPGRDDLLAFGQAELVRQGTEATVVAWGAMVMMAVDVADRLAQEGYSVDLIDLRTLVPLDFSTVLASLRKTGKLLIIHEAPGNCGFGAELAARAAEEGFSFLDAPIVRVTGANCPVPYGKELEEAVLPQKADLESALRALIRY